MLLIVLVLWAALLGVYLLVRFITWALGKEL